MEVMTFYIGLTRQAEVVCIDGQAAARARRIADWLCACSQEGTPPPSGGQPPQVPDETAKAVDACVCLGLPLPRVAAG